MDWRPQTQADYIKADAKARRVKEAGGTRAKLPFVRYWMTSAFSWSPPATLAPVKWNSLREGDLRGLSYNPATGLFTIDRAGLWLFDARLGIGTESNTYANTYWLVNSTRREGTGGAPQPAAFTNHGCPMIGYFNVGDTIGFVGFSNGGRGGVVADAGTQLSWLTARMLEK